MLHGSFSLDHSKGDSVTLFRGGKESTDVPWILFNLASTSLVIERDGERGREERESKRCENYVLLKERIPGVFKIDGHAHKTAITVEEISTQGPSFPGTVGKVP